MFTDRLTAGTVYGLSVFLEYDDEISTMTKRMANTMTSNDTVQRLAEIARRGAGHGFKLAAEGAVIGISAL